MLMNKLLIENWDKTIIIKYGKQQPEQWSSHSKRVWWKVSILFWKKIIKLKVYFRSFASNLCKITC